jgi:hypothetical protein
VDARLSAAPFAVDGEDDVPYADPATNTIVLGARTAARFAYADVCAG